MKEKKHTRPANSQCYTHVCCISRANNIQFLAQLEKLQAEDFRLIPGRSELPEVERQICDLAVDVKAAITQDRKMF
jgi:hypothetical protein